MRRIGLPVLEPESGCLIWQGALDKDGYGRTWHHGKRIKAHRAAYIDGKGEIPEGLEIDHLCFNRPPDDQSAASAPAEPVEHLHMTSWELAAALVAELHALAGRDGTAVTFNLLVKDTYAKLVRNGLTASPADRGER